MTQEDIARNITVHNADRSLTELQALVGNWSDANFGADRTDLSYRSLFGIIEEFGELVHSQLKMEQNIRGTAEEHMAKIEDAVGDIVFYMMDYLHMMNIEIGFDWPVAMEDFAFRTLFDKTLPKVVFTILRRLTGLCDEHDFYSGSHATQKAKKLLLALNAYCVRSGIDMKQAVWTTAEQVFTRDWIKFPKDGKTE